MKSYRELKNELLKDSQIKKAYQELEPEFAFIRMLIKQRIEEGLTQAELASRIGTKQSAIARLESGSYNPTLAFLRKVADALNAKLRISLS